MTTLIIIRGNAASGKTSLAKALQTALGEKTLLLSQDQLRRDMLHARDGFDTPTISLILNLLDYGQQHCDYIILEGILRADWYQPVWEKSQSFSQIATMLIIMTYPLRRPYIAIRLEQSPVNLVRLS